jgi:aerobic-type carbon monoxide dehydrogenase small subunit (CoxS/CutS family)
MPSIDHVREIMNVAITINQRVVELDIEPDEMLVYVLRERLGLIGTKIGCGEGECGACTVLMDGLPVNSCLIPAVKAHQRSILTVEGLGSPEKPHPIQLGIAQAGGAQCGYCSPGFVMSAYALLMDNNQPSIEEIKDAFSGNLCRCTGYMKIVQAVLEVNQEINEV